MSAEALAPGGRHGAVRCSLRALQYHYALVLGVTCSQRHGGGVAIGVVALVIGMVVYCLAVRKRKRLKVSGTKQVKAEI